MDDQRRLGLQEGQWSEDSLVAALKAGDEQAAEVLVRSEAGRMIAVAKRMLGDHALAEDCVQDAFIKLFRNIDGFEQRSSLRSWVHRIVVNEALMKLRSKRTRGEASIDELMPEFDENACRIEGPWQYLATPEEIFARQDRRALVLTKIQELPESYRVVLLLRDIEELSSRVSTLYWGVGGGSNAF